MRSTSVVLSILLLSVFGSAVPLKNKGIDAIKSPSLQRDLQTMDSRDKRAAEAEDADEAIAYAWFTESPTK